MLRRAFAGAVCALLLVAVCEKAAKTQTQTAQTQQPPPPPIYTLIDLGVPGIPVGPMLGGAGINDFGDIVGAYAYSAVSFDGPLIDQWVYGFRWELTGRIATFDPANDLSWNDLIPSMPVQPGIPQCDPGGVIYECWVQQVMPRGIDNGGTIAGTIGTRIHCLADCGDWIRFDGFTMAADGTRNLAYAPGGAIPAQSGIPGLGGITGISNGTLVGLFFPPNLSVFHGFFGSSELAYPGVSDTTSTGAFGANRNGDVVGFYGGTLAMSDDPNNPNKGFVLHGGSYLPIKMPRSYNTEPFGINDAGTVVGNWVDDGTVDQYHGIERVFVWPNFGQDATQAYEPPNDSTDDYFWTTLGINNGVNNVDQRPWIAAILAKRSDQTVRRFAVAIPCYVNHPPVAKAGGPYRVDRSVDTYGIVPLQLDGTHSTDPDLGCGDSITYAWTLDGISLDDVNGAHDLGADLSSPLASQPAPLLVGTAIHNLQPGLHQLSLTVTDLQGATNTDTTIIDIADTLPLASFNANPNPAACGQSITFDGSGSGALFIDSPSSVHPLVEYAWDFGDGTFAPVLGVAVTHGFARIGSYGVKLTVTDTTGASSTLTQMVAVQGTRGPVANAGGPYQTDPTSGLLLDGTGTTDPDLACGAVLTYQWDVDGNFVGGGSTFGLNLAALQAIGLGTHTVLLTVADAFGHSSTAQTTLTIAGRITLSLPNSASVSVNTAPWGCGSFVDNAGTGAWLGTVNYGDGSGDQPLALGGPTSGACASISPTPTGTFSFDHLYAAAGQFTVSVTISNTVTGASQSGTFPITVANTDQIVLGMPNALTVQIHQSPWGCGSFFDAAAGAWSATIDYGDGSGSQSLPLAAPPSGPCAASGNSSTGVFSFDHAYATTGQFTVTVTAQNTMTGVSQTGTLVVTVTGGQIFLGIPNTASALVKNPAPWGCGSFTDTNAAGGLWSATVDYGDGSGSQLLTLVTPASGNCSSGNPTGSFVFSHAYATTGARTVTLTVTDTVTGVSKTGTFTVTVNAGQISLSIPNATSTSVNQASLGCGSFIDSNSNGGLWSGTADYGDGGGPQWLTIVAPPPTSGPCAPQGGGPPPTGVFAFNHAYSSTGQFTVTVQVQDPVTGAVQTGTFPITVTTGGGDHGGPALVSIDVAPQTAHVLVGGTQQYIATGYFADGSSRSTDPNNPGNGPTWSSTDTTVATVDQNGLVTTIAPGQTSIVASAEGVSCATTTTCGVLTVDSFNTPTGDSVNVAPANATGATPVTIQFAHVTGAGETSVTASTSGPAAPAAFNVGNTFYDVTTTAAFDGSVTVCVTYQGVALPPPVYLRLLHFDGSAWVDVTSAISTVNQFVCGTTPTLSPFVIASAIDTTPPVIGAVAGITAEATGASGAVVTFALPTATDDLDPAPIVGATPPSGSTFAVGTTTVVVTATDHSGNSSSASFGVTVRDTTPPVVTTSGNVVVKANGKSTPVTFTATAVDAVDGAIVPVCVPASGSGFAVGATTVTCSATDAHHNTGSASFTVTVVKGSLPKISDPNRVVVEATGPGGAVVLYDVSATQDGAVVPVTCSPASGSQFPLGTATVTCSATAPDGLSATDTFPVIVRDTTPPDIVSIAPDNLVLPPTGLMTPVTFSVTAVDLVDPAPSCAITKVTSNVNDPAGSDWTITGPLSVSVEAAAAKHRNRQYVVTIQCTDASGNKSKEKTTIVVSQMQP